jgi:two-component system NtrC family sensor kinase
MIRFRNLSLKNKFFSSSLAVILLVSLLIALFTRWILISSLTAELKRRGLGIAQSIAESSTGYILTHNTAELTNLVFDARLSERRQVVAYSFVLDKQNEVLAHSFLHPFPVGFNLANPIDNELAQSIKLLALDENSVYDVAVPVKEGIYQIGSVHVGINKRHIDQLIGKLRTTFVGFVSLVTVVFFLISHWLSRYITRPITELIKISDDVSRGHFDLQTDLGQNYTSSGDEVRQLADSFVNMTNRIKSSQDKLRESEGKYRSLFAGGPNPIFVVDHRTLDILDANPAAEEAYGYTKQELTRLNFSDLGPFEYREPNPVGEERGEWPKAHVVSSKVQYYKKGNQPFYVNVHASPARYQDRDAIIIATSDISETVEKDSQLIQASKMKTLGEMSAGIAHELNQPLNAIKMGSEYLNMMIEIGKGIDDRDLAEAVTEISAQVDRAADIIKRLRDFGRKADFTREKVDLNQPIKSVLDIVGKQLSLQNISLELALDETIPLILAHKNRMEQVIFNLITNARDAINQKQELGPDAGARLIRIRTFTEHQRVVLTVSDTGIGIPPSVREKIFEAFFTMKQMGEGMGLGLSITYGIVSDYSGDIQVESQEGVGATFKLTFPSAAADTA